MTAKEKLKNIIIELKENQTLLDKINDSTDLINDIGLDSLQMINFLLKLEDEFNIEIDFDNLDYSQMRSFGKLSKFIDRQIEQSTTLQN